MLTTPRGTPERASSLPIDIVPRARGMTCLAVQAGGRVLPIRCLRVRGPPLRFERGTIHGFAGDGRRVRPARSVRTGGRRDGSELGRNEGQGRPGAATVVRGRRPPEPRRGDRAVAGRGSDRGGPIAGDGRGGRRQDLALAAAP